MTYAHRVSPPGLSECDGALVHSLSPCSHCHVLESLPESEDIAIRKADILWRSAARQDEGTRHTSEKKQQRTSKGPTTFGDATTAGWPGSVAGVRGLCVWGQLQLH